VVIASKTPFRTLSSPVFGVPELGFSGVSQRLRGWSVAAAYVAPWNPWTLAYLLASFLHLTDSHLNSCLSWELFCTLDALVLVKFMLLKCTPWSLEMPNYSFEPVLFQTQTIFPSLPSSQVNPSNDMSTFRPQDIGPLTLNLLIHMPQIP